MRANRAVLVGLAGLGMAAGLQPVTTQARPHWGAVRTPPTHRLGTALPLAASDESESAPEVGSDLVPMAAPADDALATNARAEEAGNATTANTTAANATTVPGAGAAGDDSASMTQIELMATSIEAGLTQDQLVADQANQPGGVDSTPALAPAVQAAAGSQGSTLTEAVPTSVTATMATAAPPGSPQGTNGVGGAWDPPPGKKATEYKPSSSGSWGVFPRPRDISKTYGGGRRVGVGAPGLDEKKKAEQRARDDRIRMKLIQYRSKMKKDIDRENKYKEFIELAMQEAQLFMRRGLYGDAAARIEEVLPFISFRGPLGGKCYLDLGMALEATGQKGSMDRAEEIYRKVEKLNQNDSVKRQASQLAFGFEAMRALNCSEVDYSEVKSVASAFEVPPDKEYYNPKTKKYERGYAAMGAASTASLENAMARYEMRVDTFSDARRILLRCAREGVENSVLLSPRRVRNAIKRIAEDRAGPNGAIVTSKVDNVTTLEGSWRLLLESPFDGKVNVINTKLEKPATREFGPAESPAQRRGEVSSTAPAPFGQRAVTQGGWTLDTKSFELGITVREGKFGALALPFVAQPEPAQLLTVDDELLVLMSRGDNWRLGNAKFVVWVRDPLPPPPPPPSEADLAEEEGEEDED